MSNPKVRTLTISGVTYDLQDNISGYITGITSSDVTTALGFTPYNSTNPNGYTTNTGTITSVKTTAGAHTAIDVSSGAANFNVPTKTSHLINDSGFLTSFTETDPTVPSWAKASSKPSYNFSEIGSTPTTISGYGITDAYTKTEVDNKVSAVLRYKGVKAAISNLPTSGNVTGDVWHVTATSGEYAWDGTEWQELGTAISIPANTGSSTTGISIAAHSTDSIYGVSSSTTSVYGVSSSTTTASKVTLGTAKSIPNVTGNTDVTVPIRADADTTVPTAASSATTVPIKNTSTTTIPTAASSATACDDITSWSAGSGSASLTFAMDTTDTKKLKITFSHTHTAPALEYTARSITGVSGSTSIYGVQSSTTSVTGVSGSTTVRGVKTGTDSTTTASKVTLGTAISVPNVTVVTDVTVPIKNADATTVPIKNGTATTVVTSATHNVTDSGHTHSI